MKNLNILLITALSVLSGVSARAFPAPENALLERSFDIVAREIEGPPKKGPPAKGPPAKKPKCKRSSGLEKRNDRGGWNPNHTLYHPGDIVSVVGGGGHIVKYQCKVEHNSTEPTKPGIGTEYSAGFWGVAACD